MNFINFNTRKRADVTVDDTGAVRVTGGGGGGGGGDASAANQLTGNASLASIDSKTPVLGQGPMATSQPVVIASNQTAIPVSGSVATASGNITTQNLVPAGTATAGSAVELTMADGSTLAIQVTGTYTGALSLQATVDGTNWVTIGGTAILNMGSGGYSATIASAAVGLFKAQAGGAIKARVTGLAAVTGTAVVTLRASPSEDVISAIPIALAGGQVVTTNPSASTNLIGDVGLQVRAGTVANVSIAKIRSAASVNNTLVKASAGRILSIQVANTSAAWKFLKLYNKATAPVAGTDTPVAVVPLKPGDVVTTEMVYGIPFATGIGYAITNLTADLDATAVAADEVVGMIRYA